MTAPGATSDITRAVWLDGKPAPQPGQQLGMAFQTISDDYFSLLGIPLRRGRTFTPHDEASAMSVAIVNETFARRYFPGEEAVGKRIGFGDRSYAKYWRTIVGVAADTRRQPSEAPSPTAFIPFRQNSEPWSFGAYMVKTSLPDAAAADLIRRAVLSADPAQPISRVRTLDATLRQSVAVQRFATLISGAFATLALLLAAVGTFGVMSHIVGTRTREMGVRMALGARGADIVRLVLGQTVRVVTLATLVGIGGAVVLGRSMQSLLFEVAPGDPLTLSAAACLLAMVALSAAYLPVRRALAQNPLASLKTE
jgi:predicted permease